MSVTKTRAKNFSNEEISTLVDLVMENKPKLFGSFSATSTFDEKNAIWEQIASTISQEHQTIRTKDDVFKKWTNILVKYKPIISDKLSSAKRTGGGPAEAGLTELELKLKSIKGKETCEGISTGLDLSMVTNSPLSEVDMIISPVAPLQTASQSGSEFDLEIKHPRKRKFSNDLVTGSVKERILGNKIQKIEILHSIDSKLGNLTESITSSNKRIVDRMDLLISNQNKFISLMSNVFSGMLPSNPLPPFQSSTHMTQGFQQHHYFPPLPPLPPFSD